MRASEHLGIPILFSKFVKTPKKSAIFDHILGDKTNFGNFLILIKENISFKLQLEGSLLLSSDIL